MNEIVIPGLYLLSGICAYASFNHFTAGLRQPIDLAQLVFAVIAMVTVVSMYTNILMFKATDIEQMVVALKLNLTINIVNQLIFLWFINLYTGKHALVLLIGLCVLSGVLLVVNYLQPFSLQYQQIIELKTLILPWGELLMLPSGRVSPWFYLAISGFLLNNGYIYYALVCLYRRSKSRYALGLIIAFSFRLICGLQGVSVRLSIIDFPHLGPLGFLTMVIAMSLILNHEMQQRLSDSESFAHATIDAVSAQICVLDRSGKILAINRAWREFRANLFFGVEQLGYSTGDNFLETCQLPGYSGSHETAALLEGIRQVSKGECESFALEYPYYKESEQFWFLVKVTRFQDNSGYVVVAYESITERKQIEERYRQIVETSNEGIWSIDAQFNTIFVNSALCRILGYSYDEIVGQPLQAFIFTEDLANLLNKIEENRISGGGHHERRFRHKTGSEVWCLLTSTAMKDIVGNYTGSFAMVTDITERKHAEIEMRLAALVYQSSTEAMMVTDAENRIITVNPAFNRLTGYSNEEVIGQFAKVLSSNLQDSVFYDVMWEALNKTGSWRGELWNRRKNGELYPEWLSINTVYNTDRSVYRRVALFSDITEKKENEELIWRQANFDVLTNLPNRRMAYDRLNKQIQKAHRGDKQLALLFIDLDRFKEVNDSFGHKIGDELLVEAARRMTGNVRETDIVGRLGGDEFVVILSDLEDIGNVNRVANTLLEKLAAPYQLGNEKMYISASMGISIYPDDAKDVETLFKNVDQALYAAKRKGRNRFQYYTSAMQEDANARMRMINDLHIALAEQQFEVHYQPIVELATGGIQKAEALIRWLHPSLGMISPVSFIPIAEDTGQIVEIGEWVFRQAADQSRRLRASYHPDFQVSVNKSPIQFRLESDYHKKWMDYLNELGMPGQGIVIEITEGLLMEAKVNISRQLLKFRDNGAQVALDDFGTGYSSLSYLKRFDIDYIKIDRSFIMNLSLGSSDLALCEAMIVMAHKLGIRVIAEGVETQGQCNILKQIDCDYGQGYLFSRPLSIEKFDKFLGLAPITLC